MGLWLCHYLLNSRKSDAMKPIRSLICFALLASTAALSAQERRDSQSRRVPATVVIVDSLPQRGAPFMIVRRPEASPADVIMLLPGADPVALSNAIRALLTARQAGGDFPSSAATLRVRPQLRGGTVSQPPFPWAPRVVEDLRRAETREVDGIGYVRAIVIWLPPQDRGGVPR